MKNFTKTITNKTLFKPTRWLIMALMLFVGTSSAWAANTVAGGYVYFDNTKTGWSDACIQFVIGHSSFSRTYTMTKITNTNLYYVNLSNSTYHDWGDATYYAVIGTSSKWGDGNWGSSNLTNATHRTAAYTTKYNMDADNKRYIITPNNSSNGTAISIEYQGTSANSIQEDQTAKIYTNGSSSANGGTVKMTGYYMDNDNAVKSSESTSTSASITFGATPTTTMTLLATAKTNYKFDGWYNVASGGTALSTSTTYTYTVPNSTKTIYARFLQQYTVTYNANNGSGAPAAETKTYDVALTLSSTTPTRTGYNFVEWNTKADGTGTEYAPGASYTSNATVTLYAQWELACPTPAQPQLSSSAVSACKGAYQSMGYVIIGNMDDFQDDTYTFELGSSTVKPAADGKLGINSIAYTNYTVTVTNSCGQSNSNDVDIEIKDNTPTIGSFTVAGNSPICPGNKATLTANVTTTKGTIASYSWSPSNGTKNENKYTTPALTQNTSYLGQVKLVYEGCEKTFSATSYTVQVRTAPSVPTPTVTKSTLCDGTPNNDGSITITPVDGVTYTLSKGNETYTRRNNDYISLAPGTYTLTATLDACQALSNSAEIEVEADDKTPVVEILTMPADFSSCDGQLTNQGIGLENWEEEEGYTYAYQWQSSNNGTTFSDMNGMTSSGMTPILNGTTWYRVKVTKSKDGCTSPEKISNAVIVTANPLSEATVSVQSVTYDQNTQKFSFTGVLDERGCSQDIYVGYRYKLSNDDNWGDLTNITHLTNEYAVNGKVFTNADITIPGVTPGSTYLFQAYAINGYPNGHIVSNAVFSDNTISVTVEDGYYIYVRRPMSGDNTGVYSNWYAWSSAKGGALFAKSGNISGSKDNNQATINNTGGTEMTEAFTDCEGHTWDRIKIAANQTKVHLHALNDNANNGWATFSTAGTVTANQDNYFYLSSWSDGEYGVTLTKTTKPALGLKIAALGGTEIINNNMASFAALYLSGNCTGKDLKKDKDDIPTGFQWMYSDNNSDWSEYTEGAGGTWNNIRPQTAGFYKLVCTMEDDTQEESNVIEITETTGSYTTADLINITSNLPIIMVNTGGKGFPECVNNSDYPSKHAETLKAKRSVDVKIKVGNEIVYDKKARMNYRGSSSLNFKKKSYAFCPGADMCGLDEDKSPDYVDTKKIDMLSLITNGAKTSVKDKDWVLYAANPDPSMMRNILAMETFSAMTGKWGVKNQYVELYVDGEYQGVYVFMDKITQNKNGRVQVTWDVKDASKRGFILKFDKTDVADRYEDTTGDQKTFESDMTGNSGVISYGTEIDQRFEIEYPEKEDIEDDGGNWSEVYSFIKGKVDAFEKALKDGDFNAVRGIIDYESWADFFLINEFSKNADAYRASCIFVYEDNLLKAYPLWDYELSFDNEVRQEHGVNSESGLLIKQTTYGKATGENGTFPAPFWWTGNYYNIKTYKGLLDDPCFVAMIKSRWQTHTASEGALTAAKLQALVSGYNSALTNTDATTTYNTPQKREAKKWPYDGTTRGKASCNGNNTGYYGQGAGNAISEVETFANSKSTLDEWIKDTGRRKGDNGTGGLNKEINDLSANITFSIDVVADKTTTTPWRPVTITVNSNSGYEYSIIPEPAKLEENGHMYTIYLARPEKTEGTNFTTQTNAYTFKATTGDANQCGTTVSPTVGQVQITLEDVVENCNQ